MNDLENKEIRNIKIKGMPRRNKKKIKHRKNTAPLIRRGKILHKVLKPTAIDVSRRGIDWHFFFFPQEKIKKQKRGGRVI